MKRQMKPMIMTAAVALIAGSFVMGDVALAYDRYDRHDRRESRWDRRDDRRDDRRENRWERRDDRRDNRWERRDDRRHYNNGYHNGWRDRSDWRRGGYVSRYDWDRGYRVDYRRHRHLHAPPYGYEWRRVDDSYVLAAVATGLIAGLIIGSH